MLPRHDFFTKEIHRLLHGGVVAVRKHSQSPVLPWAWLAYDARLNAGSTAVVPKLEPPPGIAPNWLPYQRRASLKMLWGRENWSP